MKSRKMIADKTCFKIHKGAWLLTLWNFPLMVHLVDEKIFWVSRPQRHILPTFSWCLTEWQSAFRKRTRVVTSLMEQEWVGAQHTHRPFSPCPERSDVKHWTAPDILTYCLFFFTCNTCTMLCTLQVSIDLTICAFWQESMEPARLRITHTADSSMNSDTCGGTQPCFDVQQGVQKLAMQGWECAAVPLFHLNTTASIADWAT